MKVIIALFATLTVSGVMSQSAVSYSASIAPGYAPVYDYAYNVNDPSSGNYQNHQQTGRGDAVSGSYSLLQADGTTRIVDYTADDLQGFNAQVRYEPHGAAPVAPKVVIPQPRIHFTPVLPTGHLAAEPVNYVQQLPQLTYNPYAYAAPHTYPYSDHGPCVWYGQVIVCPPGYEKAILPPQHLSPTVLYK